MSAAPEEFFDEVMPEQPIDDMLAALAAAGKFEPGQFYDDIQNPLYHGGPGVSSSNLKTIAQSPAHYRVMKDHPKPSTPTMMFGTAFHTLLLEPDIFAATYVRAPYQYWTTKEAKLWRAAQQAAGKVVLSGVDDEDEPFWKPCDWTRLHNMRNAIMEHPMASLFLQRFIPERSMYWLEPVSVRLPDAEIQVNELAKARFDGIDIAHNIGFDLKTAADASYSGFTRAVVDYGYHISRQWYMRGQAATGHALQEFVFIVVEKEPPYAVGAYTIDQRFRGLADSLIRVYLETYSRCRELNEWPAYPINVRELQTPKYAEFIHIS